MLKSVFQVIRNTVILPLLVGTFVPVGFLGYLKYNCQVKNSDRYCQEYKQTVEQLLE